MLPFNHTFIQTSCLLFSQAIPELTSVRVLKMVDDCVGHPPKTLKGREQKDHHFGHAFGLLSVVQSGRLATDDSASVVSVLVSLLELARRKAYLADVCAQIAVDLVEALPMVVLKGKCASLYASRVSCFVCGGDMRVSAGMRGLPCT